MAKQAIRLTEKQAYLLLIAVLVVIAGAGVVLQGMSAEERAFTEEESLKIARKAVLGSPTFVFDGYELVHVQTVQARCPQCWGFTFRFKSAHAGYGDRTGQVLAQVITPHSAFVVVERGVIGSNVLDERWDVMNQEFLDGKGPADQGTGGEQPETPEPPPEPPAETPEEPVAEPGNGTSDDNATAANGTLPLEPAGFCGWSTNASCSSDAGCKASGCSGQVCISLSQWSVTTTCEWRECYDASAYNVTCGCVDGRCEWA